MEWGAEVAGFAGTWKAEDFVSFYCITTFEWAIAKRYLLTGFDGFDCVAGSNFVVVSRYRGVWDAGMVYAGVKEA